MIRDCQIVVMDLSRGVELYCQQHGLNDSESERMISDIARKHYTFRNELIDLGRRNRLDALRECALSDEELYFKVARLEQDYCDVLNVKAMTAEAAYE